MKSKSITNGVSSEICCDTMLISWQMINLMLNCHALSQYFTDQEHCKNTRYNKCSVCLPRSGKTFNELPFTARMSDNAFDFREIMNNIYV